MPTITSQDIARLATLSHLTLTDNEIESLPAQLEESLNYVENLQDVDTSTVPETFFTTDAHNVMDEDIVDASCMLTQDEAIRNAPATRKGYFVVKRIL